MTIDEILKVTEKFKAIINDECNCYGNSPEDIIDACKKLKGLGYEWGQLIPRGDFEIRASYYMSHDRMITPEPPDEWIILWSNRGCGAYQFVKGESAYFAVQDDYKGFMDELKTYNPIAWNNYDIIFNIENGKRLIEDYPDIVNKWRGEMEKSIKNARLERAKKGV